MRRLYSIVISLAAVSANTAFAAQFTYVNERFGTVCTFRDDIFTDRQPEPENDEAKVWLSADGASLTCSGIPDIDHETPKDFAVGEKTSNEPGYKVTYGKAGKDWAVLSG